MGCYVCDKSPIAGIKHNRELCHKHIKLALICEACDGFFIGKSERARTCNYCNKKGKYLSPSIPNQKYVPSKKEYPKKECANCGIEFKPNVFNQIYCNESCSYNSLSGYEKDRILIFDRDGYQCIYCGKTSYGDRTELHVDHIYPKSKGGTNYIGNLVTSCVQCNLGKHNKIFINIELILKEVEKRNKENDLDSKLLIKLK